MKGVPGNWKLLGLVFTALATALVAIFGLTEAQYLVLRITSNLDDGLAYLAGAAWPEGTEAPPAPRVYYHRARPLPELTDNSQAALEAAERLQTPIEFDVAFTADGKAYVSHGDDLTSGLLAQLSEAEYLLGVSSGRFLSREKLTTALEKFSQPASSYVFDLKPRKGQEATAAETLLRDVPKPYRMGSIFISRSGRTLLRLKRAGIVANIGCESFSPLANRLAGMSWYSHEIHTVRPWSDRLARWLGLSRIYWVVRSPQDMALASAIGPDIVLVDPAVRGMK